MEGEARAGTGTQTRPVAGAGTGARDGLPMDVSTPPSPRSLRVEGGGIVLRGAFEPPGDKSIAHRAAMLAAICAGDSQVRNYPPGQDCASTLRCLRSLGVSVRKDGDSLIVSGRGLRSLEEPVDVLDAGNSGTTMRLLAGILAGQDGLFVLTGDASLRRRPMGRVAAPLRAMGARVDGRAGGTLAPLVIRGAGNAGLLAIRHVLPVASAQVKSCILLAGLYSDGETTVVEPARSRDHTERVLQFAGVPVKEQRASAGSDAREVSVCGGQAPRPFRLTIPGDPSSAAFLLAAAAALPGSSVTAMGVCANPTRLGFIRVLADMGASVSVEPARCDGPEPVADIRVEHRGHLVGVEIPPRAVPSMIDEVPMFAVLACAASTPSSIRGIDELRVKETDRVAAVVEELSKMGAHVSEDGDSLRIYPSRLHGARVSARGDHRMAMALAVAGLMASGTTVVEDWDSVSVSYPGFLAALHALSAPSVASEEPSAGHMAARPAACRQPAQV